MKESLENIYGYRLRLRVCGLLQRDESWLLVKHTFSEKNVLWIPPGGEVNFGETAEEALKREFIEETGLDVSVGEILFVYEYINHPYHAVELFFSVRKMGGELKKGEDPETKEQVISEVRHVSFSEIKLMNRDRIHGIFGHVKDPGNLKDLKGFYRAPDP